jgi:hypothetical protein
MVVKTISTMKKDNNSITAASILIFITVGILITMVYGNFRWAIIPSPEKYFPYKLLYIVIGIFSIIGIPLGIISGIFMMERKRYSFSIVGIIFILITGFLCLWNHFVHLIELEYWIEVLPYSITNGLFPFIFPCISLILILKSKREFT